MKNFSTFFANFLRMANAKFRRIKHFLRNNFPILLQTHGQLLDDGRQICTYINYNCSKHNKLFLLETDNYTSFYKSCLLRPINSCYTFHRFSVQQSYISLNYTGRYLHVMSFKQLIVQTSSFYAHLNYFFCSFQL